MANSIGIPRQLKEGQRLINLELMGGAGAKPYFKMSEKDKSGALIIFREGIEPFKDMIEKFSISGESSELRGSNKVMTIAKSDGVNVINEVSSRNGKQFSFEIKLSDALVGFLAKSMNNILRDLSVWEGEQEMVAAMAQKEKLDKAKAQPFTDGQDIQF